MRCDMLVIQRNSFFELSHPLALLVSRISLRFLFHPRHTIDRIFGTTERAVDRRDEPSLVR